jgi:aminoglycoside phosphotransferase
MNDGSTDAETALNLPADLAAELDGFEWERDNAGESGSTVIRLHRGSARPTST